MNSNLKKLWEKEYLDAKGIPTSRQDTPSHSLPIFLNFLNRKGLKPEGRILDLGCGKGRNGLELLRTFQCEIYGIDISPSALQAFQNTVEKEGLAPRTHLTEGNLADPLPYQDNFFDLAIDIASSFRLTEDDERARYIREVYRVLRPGGFLLLYVIAKGDEYYEKILAVSPRRRMAAQIH